LSTTRIAAVLAATAIAVLGAAPAAGATTKSKTTVTISAFNYDNPPFFIGEVVSPKKACAKARRVTLYAVKGGKAQRAGSVKTIFGEGTWAWIIKTPGAGAGGVYYAEATATPSCRYDRSPRYTVPF